MNRYNEHSVPNWLSIGCVAPYDGKIYNLNREINVFNDPKALDSDAVPELLDDMPIRLRRPGTCAGYDIDGFKGEYRWVDLLICIAYSHLVTNMAMKILLISCV